MAREGSRLLNRFLRPVRIESSVPSKTDAFISRFLIEPALLSYRSYGCCRQIYKKLFHTVSRCPRQMDRSWRLCFFRLFVSF